MKCRSPRRVRRFKFLGIKDKRSPPFAKTKIAKGRPPERCLFVTPWVHTTVVSSRCARIARVACRRIPCATRRAVGHLQRCLWLFLHGSYRFRECQHLLGFS